MLYPAREDNAVTLAAALRNVLKGMKGKTSDVTQRRHFFNGKIQKVEVESEVCRNTVDFLDSYPKIIDKLVTLAFAKLLLLRRQRLRLPVGRRKVAWLDVDDVPKGQLQV